MGLWRARGRANHTVPTAPTAVGAFGASSAPLPAHSAHRSHSASKHPWHRPEVAAPRARAPGAAFALEVATAALPLTVDVCLVCGGGPHYASKRLAESELLTCHGCGESYHAFCCPPPTPSVTEETRLHWTCQRCRPPVAPPKAGSALAASPE